MKVGVVKEIFPGERRVALVPATTPALVKAGLEVVVEAGAGEAAGFPDTAYQDKGAEVVRGRREVFSCADVILQVRSPGANPVAGKVDLDLFRKDQVLIGFAEPLTDLDASKALAQRGVVQFAMELIPRITRAQSMDALSSMASIAGYKAVLLAADTLPRMFPMMMTAAGTITPAKVFILGAGVAGLQAVATAKRLGAVVKAFDVRAAVKEQVQSLGGKFVEFDLGVEDAEANSGYAKELTDEQKQKQQELMANVVAESDVVITTAAVPGRKAPVLVKADTVRRMVPGSLIIDLAAERGGNCELTRPDEIAVEHGVSILGPVNLPSAVPYHASQMYSKNISTFLLHLVKEGRVQFDLEDEITKETLVTRGGEVVHPRVKEMMNQSRLP